MIDPDPEPTSPITPAATSVPAPFYGPGGHKLTTFIVAKIAGVPDDRAYLLAAFTQEPDVQKWMDATSPSNLATLAGRKTKALKNALHSLHGGDRAAVDRRREALRGLIVKELSASDSDSDWKVGLLIHALGDAYAHTDEKGEAYHSTLGHLCDWKTPDDIYHDLAKFKEFTRGLLDLLMTAGTGGHEKGTLEYFHKVLDNGKSANDMAKTDVADAEDVVRVFAEYTSEFDGQVYDTVPRNVPREDIEQFIDEFAEKLGVRYE